MKTAEGAFWSELVLDRGALGSYRLDELPDDLPVLRVVPVDLESLEVVEVNPILDQQNSTAELAVELILSAMGKKIL